MSKQNFQHPDHLVACGVPQDFAEVIVASAEKNKTTFSEEFIKLAIEGAECRRRHSERKNG